MKLQKHINILIEKISSNKKYTNLALIISTGIILLIGISVFVENEDSNLKIDTSISEEKEMASNSIDDYSNKLEIKLKQILSEMKGVGDVEVMITLVETTESVPAINKTSNKETTKENDSQGGIRDVIREESTEQIVTNGSGGEMITIKQIKPEIRGVIVAAEGAEDIKIKENVYNAVKTALDLSGNKVEIYVKK